MQRGDLKYFFVCNFLLKILCIIFHLQLLIVYNFLTIWHVFVFAHSNSIDLLVQFRVFLLRLLGAKRIFYRENCITCKLLRSFPKKLQLLPKKNVQGVKLQEYPIEGSIFYRYFSLLFSCHCIWAAVKNK